MYSNLSLQDTSVLLERGANPDGEDSEHSLDQYHITPLGYELLYMNDPFPTPRATLLLKHGADVNATNIKTGECLLYACAQKGVIDQVKWLLYAGALVCNVDSKELRSDNNPYSSLVEDCIRLIERFQIIITLTHAASRKMSRWTVDDVRLLSTYV